jgi:hypothetical protein
MFDADYINFQQLNQDSLDPEFVVEVEQKTSEDRMLVLKELIAEVELLRNYFRELRSTDLNKIH